MDNIVAREGMEQRIVPTGMATRGNEIERHRNFSESIFREWLPADSVWLGMMEAQCGIAVPVYVTRFGDSESQSDIFRLNRGVMWRKRHVIL
jgi:hypothetical protein